MLYVLAQAALLVFAVNFGIANGLLARAAASIAVTGLLLVLPGYRALMLMLVLSVLGVLALLAFWWARPPARVER